ncbi:MAG TPA: YraN family protein [Solirubrobacterales bacterium]|jgi:putative endonuclease
MTLARQRIGRRAEDLVAARLAAAGWRILERNARNRLGEIDIVALDGSVLVFVEVKAGRAGSDLGPERPALAVGPRKRHRIRRVATAWIATRRGGPPYSDIRFDVFGVSFDRAGMNLAVEHIRGAF